ncbi:phage terminase small subunit [Ursidibacter sp. B-7004-1]
MNIREYQQKMREQMALEKTQSQLANGQPLAIASSGSDYQLDTLLIAARNDIARMRELPTLADRAVFKKEKFLPQYLPFVEQYFEKGLVYQNDLVGYCIVYLFDVGSLGEALALAHKAIAQNQKLPENFESNLPTFVANQVLMWADRVASTGQSVEPYFSQTFQNVATVWQLHEIVTAKWLKSAARLLIRNDDGKAHAASCNNPERLELAILLACRAFQLNQKVGVKDLVERSLARLKQLHKEGLIDELPQVEGLTMKPISIDVEKVVELLNPSTP